MAEIHRSGPLSGNQHWVWLLDTTAPTEREELPLIHLKTEAPSGMTVELLRRVVHRLMDRHETLRTSVEIGADGAPVQYVHSGVTPHITVIGDEASASPGETVAQPTWLRVVAEVSGGVVRSVEFTLPDISVDHYSIGVLRTEFEQLLKSEHSGSPPDLAPVTWHPVDQGRAGPGRGPQAVRGGSLAAWRRGLEAGPHSTLPFRWNRSLYWNRAPREGAMIESTLVSRRLAHLCRTLAGHLGVTVPTSLFALLAVILAGWTRNESCAIGVVSSNRFKPHLSNSVGRFSDELRVVIDVAGDPPFSKIARNCLKELIFAYSKGFFDVGELVMEEARQSLDAGSRFTNSVIFAYHDYRNEFTSLPADFVEGRVTQRTIDYRTPNFRLDVTPVEDALELCLRCPEGLLPRITAQALLSLFEKLAQLLVADGETPLSELSKRIRLDAPWNGPGWARVRQSWIDLAYLNHVVNECRGVVVAHVFVRRQGGRDDASRLVCYAQPNDESVTPAKLREYLRDEVSNHPSLMVPTHYVLCDSAPKHPDDLEGWRLSRVIAEGSGDAEAPDEAPLLDREAAVCSVFRSLHPDRTPRISATYAELHGDFLRIPAFLRRLADLGYSGVNFKDFIGMSSLRCLAARLERKAGE